MPTKKKRLVIELYAYAISAKRYALFDLDKKGLPVIRKASQHGLGHLSPPYGEDDPAPGVPDPVVPLKSLRIRRWHYDFWFEIIRTAMSGEGANISFDYHTALKQPAIGRFSASSPEMLRWFKGYNEGRAYKGQVRPFGFLSVLFRKKRQLGAFQSEEAEGPVKLGRPARPRDAFPVAPYEKDPQVAAQSAFDRKSGEKIASEQLSTYAEAMASYPVSAEAKFRNGRGADTGTTVRRCVKATSLRLIGKEGNKVDENGFDVLDKGQLEITNRDEPE